MHTQLNSIQGLYTRNTTRNRGSGERRSSCILLYRDLVKHDKFLQSTNIVAHIPCTSVVLVPRPSSALVGHIAV